MYSLIDIPFPFHYPRTTSSVYIVSDSEYERYQQKRAEQEITVLESKKNRLLSAANDIDAEITKIREALALPPSTPTKELNETTK